MSSGAISINIDAAGRFGNEEFYTTRYNMVADCSGDDCEDMSNGALISLARATGTTSAGLSE
jgi:hypothetical protein